MFIFEITRHTNKNCIRGVNMAVAHKSVISFGLVAIPISMFTATQDNDIHFNQLHKSDNERIQYKKTCTKCGEEITTDKIVKGFQYDKDHYVIVTDEELEKLKTEKDKSIQILHFAELNQISPIYYGKAYQATPEIGGEKAFELLRAALLSENKIAIGRTVLGTSDTLLSIIPREEGMVISTMYYADDIKELQKSYNKPEINEAELTLARTLINSMDTPFNPSQYLDEYQIKLKELIESKIAGKEIIVPKEEGPNNVINLMDALKASIEKSKPINATEKQKKPKKVKGAV
jgi:DNA end-binding protein Ku